MGAMGPMSRKRNCSAISCGSSSVISLDQQDFCLDHFLHHCYQKLEAVDPRNRKAHSAPMSVASLRAFIEECSRKALDLSLHSENLTNLQRGRLLDILLWAGELFVLLRAPRVLFIDSLVSPSPEVSPAVVPATLEDSESSAVLGKSTY
jgi:hypothetical protein